jgi:predicted glycosyltransferase
MRVLFDIVHPANVHFFKHAIFALKDRGDEVMVTARKKGITLELLEKCGIEYTCLSELGKGPVGLGRELVVRCSRLFGVARKFRPDVMVAKNGGPAIGVVGSLLRVPRVVFEDTEHAKLQRVVGLPFASYIVTGSGYLGDHGRRQRRYRGVWTQLYLDPKYFTPDPDVLRKYGVEPDEPYIVLRTIAWDAAHDIGQKVEAPESLRDVINRLEVYGRVIVSPEGDLPDSLVQYKNPVPAEHIHSLLAFARLCVSQGGSMSSEAAVLGTPAIFCNPLRCGYLLFLEEELGLVHCTDTLKEGVKTAEKWLNEGDIREKWREKVDKFRSQSDDVVKYMLGIIEEAGRR